MNDVEKGSRLPACFQEAAEDILNRVETGLEEEIAVVEGGAPNITDDKKVLDEALVKAAQLAGQRIMHNKIKEEMGLTKPD